MDYTVTKDKIIIGKTQTFDVRAILDCGQVFRYKKEEFGYSLIAGGYKAELLEEEDRVIIRQNNPVFFENYFDLPRDYDIILSKLGCGGLIGAACGFGKGIRLLNQEPQETVFNFIISANNNIPRIKLIIERTCAALGKNCGGYYAFPTVEKLAAENKEFYLKMGAGYRAEYIVSTARAIADGFNLDKIKGLPTAEARKTLCLLKGVGPKVADCILLFAYKKTDVFPVDTWIKKVYGEVYGDSPSAEEMSRRLVAEYGSLAGYAQQYLFYYKRELDRKTAHSGRGKTKKT